MKGVAAATLILSMGVSGCAAWDRVTGKQPDTAGNGDERYDETSSPEKPRPVIKDPSQCGAEGKGDVVLLDARTSLPVSCVLVTLFREPTNCGESECPAESIFQGHSNGQGLILVGQPISGSRVYAVAEGYAQSYRQPGAVAASRVAEIEMIPDDGFLLKVLDNEGNYLPGVEVTFKQGEEVLAQMRTNDLANVYFASRTPFSGESVTIQAEGYAPVTVAGPTELGTDGHTLTVRH
jgi:hypothetical protein